MLKLLVKVYISLYLLNMVMDQVDALLVGRYSSEVVCCTIKVTDFCVKDFGYIF